MAEAPDIERLILEYVGGELMEPGEPPLGLDDNLLTGGYVDSVAIVRLIAHVESALQVRIPPPDLVPQNFRTVRVMAAYLAGLQRT
jgi:acyl carrier protein